MENEQEKKNYAPTRFSRSYGESSLTLGFNKQQLIDWLTECKADANGLIKLSVSPRRSPSDANKFSVFQDTWQPDPKKIRQAVKAMEELPKDALPEDDSSSVPF